jgi:hypothetical protein
VGAFCLLLASPALARAGDKAAGPKSPPAPQPASQAQVVAAYGKLPLSFEANQGQTDSQVKFLSRGRGYGLFLTGDEAVLVLRSQKAEVRSQEPASRNSKLETRNSSPESRVPAVLRMKLVGANPALAVAGMEALPGKSNYFLGNDPKRWRTNVPNYAKVAYKNIYPGVDLVYYGNQGQLEYDFVVAPGANPKAIALEIETGNSKLETSQSSVVSSQLSVAQNGDLVIATDEGEIRLHKPIVYQLENPKSKIQNRKFLDGRYVLRPVKPDLANPKSKIENPKWAIGFEIAAYDPRRPLIIDPVLSYSTYLGGSSDDTAYGIAVDSSGKAYVTGATSSTDFPAQNPPQPANMGSDDVFVAKLDATGTNLIYSTYLGGTSGDAGRGIAVDSSGNAYVVGGTCSTDFPVVRPFQAAYGGGCGYWYGDAFVVKLDASGSTLIYSTYLGGGYFDEGRGIAVDFGGNVYVTGGTGSDDFPTQNPIQSWSPTASMIFVAKLDASGSSLVYSTYLGGGFDEFGQSIAVDSSGSAYVTGETWSNHFPTVNALQPQLGGTYTFNTDAFVTKLNPAGSALVYSTYLGGSGYDEGLGIAVDSLGKAYVTGYTCSADFPLVNPLEVDYGGECDVGSGPPYSVGSGEAFVAKLDASGSALAYSTYLGGANLDVAQSIAVDSSGSAYVTGHTLSGDFPTSSPLQAPYGGNGDAFLTKLNPSGSALVFSTYVGGSSDDGGSSVALDSLGNAYIAGGTTSLDFPTANPFQAALNGGSDAFVAKLSGLALPVVQLSATTLNLGSLGVGFTSAPRTVTLTNVGDATLIFTSFNVQSDLGPPPWSPVDFTQSNDCGAPLPSLAAGESCTLTVLFRPTATGTRTAVLVMVDNAGGSPHWVGLTGVGLAAPAVSLSVGSLDFGYQPVGSTSAPQPVTLTNTGTAALTISNIAAPTDFGQTNDCGTLPAVLGIGGSCTINVTFTPSTEGSVIDFLSITDDAPGGSPRQVTLYGTGTAYPVPLIHQPVVPLSALPGGAGFTLTVNGTGFFSNSVVKWNGLARTTNFVSSTRLTATIPASDIATAGTAWVTVVNPTPGGGTSNVSFLHITDPTSSVSLARTDLTTGTNPYGVVAADFNGDGKVDLAVANNGASTVSVLIGNGDGTFQAAVDYATGTSPFAVTTGDFNGDGVVDLAVANFNAAGPGSVSILLGNGDGTFLPHVDYATGAASVGVATADFNGDGKLDLAVTNLTFTGSLSILLGNGDGTFQSHVDYDAGIFPFSVVPGDLNGDGTLDLALGVSGTGSGTTMSVLLGNGDGTFQSATTFQVGIEPFVVATADLNGDGKLDLAVTNGGSNSVSILLGNGDGTFQTHVDYATGAAPYAVTPGDFNGDGKLDLAVSNQQSNTVSLLLGNGDGTFQAGVQYAVGANPFYLATGDFNGDGRLDLAATNANSNTVSILSQAAGVGLSPASLTFASQRIGTTSVVQSVTLSNSGTAALSIASIVASGDFAQTNTCGQSVPADTSCTIDVTFTPTATGSRTGAITITSGDPGSPHAVSLSGTGIVGPVVSLSSSSVDFLRHPLNIVDCPSIDVTLTNTGDTPLTITSIVPSSNFSETHTCGTSLAAGASCTISVQFHPPGLGTTLGTLTINSDAPGSPHTVALSGTGTPACRLLTSTRSATVLRGTDSTSFGVSDSSPSCTPVPIELSCSLQNPAACALNPATIPPSGSSTLKVSNLRSVAAEWVTVVVNAVSEFRWASESLTVLISDFAFTRAPARATVRAGEATSYALAIRPVNGLAGTVRLSCGGAPQGATCTVAPSAVTLDGSSLGQATVRVTTTARALAGPGTQLRLPVGTPRGLPLVLGLMSLAALATVGTRRRRAWLALSFSLLLVLVWAACGGGGLMSTSPGSGTPAGTYMLTVTGTYTVPSGDVELTHNTTVTLTVN